MDIEEKLKDYILSKHRSLREFVQTTDLPYSTVNGVLKRGIANSRIGNVLAICDALEISADELSNGKIIPRKKNPRQRTLLTELSEIVDYVSRNKEEYADITLDGTPLTPEELETVLDAVAIAAGILRRRRKR